MLKTSADDGLREIQAEDESGTEEMGLKPSPRSEENEESADNADPVTKSSSLDVQTEPSRWPDSVLLGLLCGCASLEGADAVLLPSTFYALQRDLMFSLNNLSVMTLAEALMMAIMAPAWGVLADRRILTRKSILVIGAVMQGFIVLSLAKSSHFTTMLGLRVMNGAFLAMLRPVSSGIIGDVVSEDLRGRAFGFVQMSLSMGMCFSALASTPLSTRTIVGISGWRLAYALIGLVSMGMGGLVVCFMVEPKREEPTVSLHSLGKVRELVVQDKVPLLDYAFMPTFLVLVAQGVFGCVPWNALGYQTLFFQVSGLGDFDASLLQAASLVATAMGSLMGGFLGDRAALLSRHHGRPLLATISVSAGIPIAWFIFTVPPPVGHAFLYYFVLVVTLGLTATWCGTGVNWPILTEVVDRENRSAVIAWEQALEGSCAAIFGNAAVAFLAQNVFGFRFNNSASSEGTLDRESITALGHALCLTSVVPWCVCFLLFNVLHWSYPLDLARTREREKCRTRNGYAGISDLKGIGSLDGLAAKMDLAVGNPGARTCAVSTDAQTEADETRYPSK